MKIKTTCNIGNSIETVTKENVDSLKRLIYKLLKKLIKNKTYRKKSQIINIMNKKGFLHSSVSKESACNVGDPGSIPGLGRSSGEGIGYPLQYSWASLVVQLVKNLLAVQETWVRSLGWEDPLEKGKATHSSILAWRISWTVHGVPKSWTQLSNFHFHFQSLQALHYYKNGKSP